MLPKTLWGFSITVNGSLAAGKRQSFGHIFSTYVVDRQQKPGSHRADPEGAPSSYEPIRSKICLRLQSSITVPRHDPPVSAASFSESK